MGGRGKQDVKPEALEKGSRSQSVFAMPREHERQLSRRGGPCTAQRKKPICLPADACGPAGLHAEKTAAAQLHTNMCFDARGVHGIRKYILSCQALAQLDMSSSSASAMHLPRLQAAQALMIRLHKRPS